MIRKKATTIRHPSDILVQIFVLNTTMLHSNRKCTYTFHNVLPLAPGCNTRYFKFDLNKITDQTFPNTVNFEAVCIDFYSVKYKENRLKINITLPGEIFY